MATNVEEKFETVDSRDENDSENAENILYDLTVNAEWPQEPELCTRLTKDRQQSSYLSRIQSASDRVFWTSLRSLGIPLKSSSPCTLPPPLVKLVNSQLNWHIAVSRDGNLVAILQDQFLEIRCGRDGFNSVVGKGSVPADSYPQWRRISWGRRGDMVAAASSSGGVVVVDVVGAEICAIPPATETMSNPNAPTDLSSAVAALIFTDYIPTSHWSHELLVANHQGTLHCYHLHREKGYQLHYTFLFSFYYPLGISCMEYSADSRLLYIGGLGAPNERSTSAREGLTCWRPVAGETRFKLVASLDSDRQKMETVLPFYRRWQNKALKRWRKQQQDGVYKMSLSPNGTVLATIHYSGTLCLWDIPSLRRRKVWLQHEQPGEDEVSPELAENPHHLKAVKDFLSKSLIDVNWWADNAMITSRCSGAITVSSVKSLSNLLGTSPEWFDPSPQVTPAHDGGFLALECECRYPSLKRRLIADDADDNDDSDDEDVSLLQRSSRMAKYALYYVTDNERFKPPRKRPRMVHRMYRMVSLKSTTPEQLYARKIDNEEYGEALALARAYNLDCDLVYQRQWRKSDVSVASIQDYLSKISKRSWVLHECLERIPEDIHAMQELLEYGLRGTDLQALISIGNRQDRGRFILCDDDEYEDFDFDPFDEEMIRLRREGKVERRRNLLSQVNFDCLSLDQREVLRARHKLLSYLRRLYTYELILGGKQAAEDRFDHQFYGKFRSQNIVEIAVEYARASDWQAVEIVFTYHGSEVLPHRLAILSNFPETTSPHEYRTLLPDVRGEEEEEWAEDEWMEADWSDTQQCRMIVEPANVDLGAFLYEETADLAEFRGRHLSPSIINAWYEYRALEIENRSRLVDNSLELVRLGQERGAQGLNTLRDDLTTMEVVVYDCGLEDSLTFTQFRELSHLDRISLLLSNSPLERFIKDLHRWVLPFLRRCELASEGAYDSLLHQYVVSASKEDLSLTVLIFETTKNGNRSVIRDQHQLVTTALDALYATTRNDQLSLAHRVHDCLPSKSDAKTDISTKLQRQISDLVKHLHAAQVLEKNDIHLTLHAIRDTQASAEDTQDLFIKISRTAGRRTPPMLEADWWRLLDDLEDLQRQCFRAVSHDRCLQIFMESLLCSGRLENIRLAGHLMEKCDPSPLSNKARSLVTSRRARLSSDKCTELILKTAREYFDSSANLLDSCMDLARACLNLSPEPTDAIREELDLISSLSLLNDFGINLLPLQGSDMYECRILVLPLSQLSTEQILQVHVISYLKNIVRLCKDRLDLVRKSVCNRPNAYKQSQKLLRLGHLVRVPGETQIDRDGQVLHLVAQAAIKVNDFEFANGVCQQLMGDNYDPIWEVCRTLAEHEHFSDIKAKFELLSFAVTYCDSDMIEPILKASSLLEMQILCEAVSTTLSDDTTDATTSSKSLKFSAVNALKQTKLILAATTKTTKDILLSTRETTKAVLSTVTDANWWHETMSSFKQPRSTKSRVSLDVDDGNAMFDKQGCHPFYGSVVGDVYVDHTQSQDLDSSDLDQVSDLDHTNDLPVNLLRAAKLEELITEATKTNHSNQVLLQLGRQTLPKDTALGLAYMLPVTQLNEVSELFDTLPKTAISLQLIAYYYALHIYQRQTANRENNPEGLFACQPSTMIDEVMSHMTQEDTSDWSADVTWLADKLKFYKNMFDDISWAQILHSLGKGVDVSRFIADDHYKRETILGLVLSLDDTVLNTAISLADRYNVPRWELYMSHVEYVFADSQLTTPEIEQRIKGLKICETLHEDADTFATRMYTYVWPIIAGKDYALLIYFYSLLQECGAKSAELSPTLHVQLLKKIRSITTGLDYKNLIDSSSHPITAISPVLTATNVNQFAKLTSKIPVQGAVGAMSGSCVFCAWAVSLFWNGTDAASQQPTEMNGWLQRYEACLEHLHKLSPLDLVSFAQQIVFISQCRQQLSIETRLTLLNRVRKYCLKQTNKKKGHELPTEWKEAKSILDGYVRHLDSLKSALIGELSTSDREDLQSYVALFDLSCGDKQKLKELFVQVIRDGNSIDLLSDLISLIADPVWSPRSVVKDVVAACITDIGEQPNPSGRDVDQSTSLLTLDHVLRSIQDHVTAGGTHVKGDDVMPLLRTFCADDTVTIQPRLDALKLMEKWLCLSDEDLALLMLYRTNAVISHVWPLIQLTKSDVMDNASRVSVFNDLLSTCETISAFTTLIQLLHTWPPLVPASQLYEENCWVRLFSSLLDQPPRDSTLPPGPASLIVSTIKDIDNVSAALDVSSTSAVVELLRGKGACFEATQVILLLGHDGLYHELGPLVSQLSVNDLDSPDLCDLILKRHLTAHIATTPLFPKVIDYLLTNQTVGEQSHDYLSANEVAAELREEGYESEAGWLLMKCRPSHPLLQTFNSARSVLSKWLYK